MTKSRREDAHKVQELFLNEEGLVAGKVEVESEVNSQFQFEFLLTQHQRLQSRLTIARLPRWGGIETR